MLAPPGVPLQLKNKIPLLVGVMGSAIFAVANYVAYRSQVAYVDEFKARQLQEIAAEVTGGISGSAKGAESYADFVSAFPSVRAAFRAKDRARLAAQLAPGIKLLQAKYGHEMGVFHAPDGKVFLRPLSPGLHGDDESHRKMVVRANKEKKPQRGLETNVVRVGHRAVLPVKAADGTHLGSFEWGFTLAYNLHKVEEGFGAHCALLVDEKAIPAPTTKEAEALRVAAAKAAEADRIVEGYRTIETSDLELMKHVVAKEALAALDGVTYAYKDVEGIEHGVVAAPLSDFGGQRIGAFYVAKSFEEPQRQVRATRVLFVATTLVGLALLAGAIQLVFNGLVLRPLLELGENLEAIAKGEVGTKIDLKKRADEIGAMAKDLDRVRDRLAKEKEAADRKDKLATRMMKIADLEPPKP